MLATGRSLRWALVAISTGTVLVTSVAVAALSSRSSETPATLSTPPSVETSVAALSDPLVALPDPQVDAVRCAAEPPLDLPYNRPPAGEVARVFRTDPKRLGSASIGFPTSGSLFNGVPITASEGITTAGDHPFGTASVIQSIKRAVNEVRRCHASSPKLSVGDISSQHGGWLRPHRSHQSGLDADLGYYYLTGPAWFIPATAENLDVERTWTLVRALIEGGNVEYVFMDRAVQKVLAAYVQTLPYDRDRIDEFFENERNKQAVIRHTHGHQTHFHVRFFDHEAVALGAQLKWLVQPNKPVPAKGKGAKPTGKPTGKATAKPTYPRPAGRR